MKNRAFLEVILSFLPGWNVLFCLRAAVERLYTLVHVSIGWSLLCSGGQSQRVATALVADGRSDPHHSSGAILRSFGKPQLPGMGLSATTPELQRADLPAFYDPLGSGEPGGHGALQKGRSGD